MDWYIIGRPDKLPRHLRPAARDVGTHIVNLDHGLAVGIVARHHPANVNRHSAPPYLLRQCHLLRHSLKYQAGWRAGFTTDSFLKMRTVQYERLSILHPPERRTAEFPPRLHRILTSSQWTAYAASIHRYLHEECNVLSGCGIPPSRDHDRGAGRAVCPQAPATGNTSSCPPPRRGDASTGGIMQWQQQR